MAAGSSTTLRVQTNDTQFDEYQPGTAQVFISDVTVTEGGTAVLTLTLSQPLAENVAVQWTTGPGTALPGSDFTGTSGTATFLIGATSVQISVPILQDTVYEGAETFNVTLANPSGGVTIGDGTGIVDHRRRDAADTSRDRDRHQRRRRQQRRGRHLHPHRIDGVEPAGQRHDQRWTPPPAPTSPARPLLAARWLGRS